MDRGVAMPASASAVVRQWFEELWNQKREDTIDRLLSPQAKVFGLSPGEEPIIGPDGFRPFYRKFKTAFPDVTVKVDHIVEQGEFCAVHCWCTGTHLGEGFGKATRTPVKFHGIAIARTTNGQIIEGYNCFDFMTAFQQIGLLPKIDS
jgi:predicted ester cyclase